MSRLSLTIVSVTTLCASFVLGACTVTTRELNPDHCSNNEGDQYCAENFAGRPLCISGVGDCTMGGRTGCVADLDDACHFPCGALSPASCGDNQGSSSSGGSSTGDGSTSESSTTGSSESTGPVPCTEHAECTDAATPLCEPELGECVACDAFGDGDEACAELDAGSPLCVDGTCVSCTAEDTSVCDAQDLVCDEASGSCERCTEHDQCASGACDVAMGRCFGPLNVLDVGDGQTYATIAAALNEVDTQGFDSAVLVLHAGSDFNESATVSSGTLAFIAAEGESPQWVNTSAMAPTLTVTGATTRVYVQGLRLAQNGNDVGLLADDGAVVDVRQSRVVQNSGGGVVAQAGADVYLENCFVGSLGGVTGVSIQDATANVLYSTISASTFGTTPALSCLAPKSVTIRNSIIVSQGGTPPDEIDCDAANLMSSATESDVSAFNTEWFEDYNLGDYRLTRIGASEFDEIAEWQPGDPLTDIDGDARPGTEGAPDYAGADVP